MPHFNYLQFHQLLSEIPSRDSFLCLESILWGCGLLSLRGRSTRIYECANAYDNFAHKCKLLPCSRGISKRNGKRFWRRKTGTPTARLRIDGGDGKAKAGLDWVAGEDERSNGSQRCVCTFHGIPLRHVGSSMVAQKVSCSSCCCCTSNGTTATTAAAT